MANIYPLPAKALGCTHVAVTCHARHGAESPGTRQLLVHNAFDTLEPTPVQVSKAMRRGLKSIWSLLGSQEAMLHWSGSFCLLSDFSRYFFASICIFLPHFSFACPYCRIRPLLKSHRHVARLQMKSVPLCSLVQKHCWTHRLSVQSITPTRWILKRPTIAFLRCA